jgi:hypothetical protein
METGQTIFRVGMFLLVLALLGSTYLVVSYFDTATSPPANLSAVGQGLPSREVIWAIVLDGFVATVCIYYGLDRYMSEGLLAMNIISAGESRRHDERSVIRPDVDWGTDPLPPPLDSEALDEAIDALRKPRDGP